MSGTEQDRARARRIPGAPEALEVADAHGLMSIHAPETALVIWRRTVPEELARTLDALAFDALPNLRFEAIACSAVHEALARALRPRMAILAPLVADVSALVRLYGEIAGVGTVRLRLEAIRDDACRRFHADQVRLRLLCTYRGPGTEWIPRVAVRLAADGYVAEPDPAAVRRLDRFAVGLLAGALSALPCIHRSPPLAGSGRDRLLLVVDEGEAAAIAEARSVA